MSEDFVRTIRLAESVRNENHPEADIISIGTYLKEFNYNRDHKLVKNVAKVKTTFVDYMSEEEYGKECA